MNYEESFSLNLVHRSTAIRLPDALFIRLLEICQGAGAGYDDDETEITITDDESYTSLTFVRNVPRDQTKGNE